MSSMSGSVSTFNASNLLVKSTHPDFGVTCLTCFELIVSIFHPNQLANYKLLLSRLYLYLLSLKVSFPLKVKSYTKLLTANCQNHFRYYQVLIEFVSLQLNYRRCRLQGFVF